ncbi:TPM domain-containing protein [Enterococcus crotali]|uniref:TPM domain-containing protein n=1 Tax=Enterococcus crotali TaxID=1453587 RepID=UPI000472F149|nr:TPM domain-containing protein [Enterococcus crotali]
MKKDYMKRQLQRISEGIFILLVLIAVIGYLPKEAKADSFFVDDQAQLLSEQTKELIIQANEQEFQQLTGAPQFVVKTIKRLPKAQTIETYAVESFEDLGIGRKDLDNGFLFVLALEDRKYRLEVGYGVEDIITDGMKRDIVPVEVEDLFRAEKYDEGISRVSQNVIDTVKQRYGNYELSKQEVTEVKKQASTNQQPHRSLFDSIVLVLKWGFYFIVFVIILLVIYYGSIYLIKNDAKQSSFFKPLRDKKVFIASDSKKVSFFEKIDGSYLIPMFFAHFNRYERLNKKIAQCFFEDTIIDLGRKMNKRNLERVPQINRQTYFEMSIELAAPLWPDYYQVTRNSLFDRIQLEQANEQLKTQLMENHEEMKQLLENFLIARQNTAKAKNLVQKFVKKQTLKKAKQEELLIMLTLYFLLAKENTLASDFSEKLTGKLSDQIPKAYKKAKKRSRYIDTSSYKEVSKEIYDMLFITELSGVEVKKYKKMNHLGMMIYLDLLIRILLSGSTSNYNGSSSGSSSSSSSGSTGGGGSSGGGGFSGGW